MFVGNDAAYGYANKVGQQAKPAGAVAGSIGERRPELADYMERLACAVSMNEELSLHLAKRLEGVMRPCAPAGEGAAMGSAGPSTHYGSQVQAAIDRIAQVNGRLQDILQRLEA
jgi:hypothetical protein